MKSEMLIKRGAIVLCEMPKYVNSSVQGNVRPAVVLSNDKANIYSSVVTIIPLTGASKKPLPVHTVVKSTVRESTALAEQLTIIDKNRIIRILGRVTDDEMCRITQAVKIQLAM